MKLQRIIMLLLVLAPFNVLYAQDASDCIFLGYEEKEWEGSGRQTLKNTCNVKIEVAWCHNNADKNFKDGLCGSNGKYFPKKVTIKPGETYSNFYSLPASGRIIYGACTGGYGSIITDGYSNGRYACK